MLVKRRGKLMTTAWRNGVAGQNIISQVDKPFETRTIDRI
jgi:hypothetical protein